jgi:hypothetical protein
MKRKIGAGEHIAVVNGKAAKPETIPVIYCELPTGCGGFASVEGVGNDSGPAIDALLRYGGWTEAVVRGRRRLLCPQHSKQS